MNPGRILLGLVLLTTAASLPAVANPTSSTQLYAGGTDFGACAPPFGGVTMTCFDLPSGLASFTIHVRDFVMDDVVAMFAVTEPGDREPAYIPLCQGVAVVEPDPSTTYLRVALLEPVVLGAMLCPGPLHDVPVAGEVRLAYTYS